jgi:hypothetical protein
MERWRDPIDHWWRLENAVDAQSKATRQNVRTHPNQLPFIESIVDAEAIVVFVPFRKHKIALVRVEGPACVRAAFQPLNDGLRSCGRCRVGGCSKGPNSQTKLVVGEDADVGLREPMHGATPLWARHIDVGYRGLLCSSKHMNRLACMNGEAVRSRGKGDGMDAGKLVRLQDLQGCFVAQDDAVGGPRNQVRAGNKAMRASERVAEVHPRSQR